MITEQEAVLIVKAPMNDPLDRLKAVAAGPAPSSGYAIYFTHEEVQMLVEQIACLSCPKGKE